MPSVSSARFDALPKALDDRTAGARCSVGTGGCSSAAGSGKAQPPCSTRCSSGRRTWDAVQQGGVDDRVGRRNRRARAFSLVVGVALVGVRVGVLAHSWTAGVGAGLAVVLLNVGLIVWSRRRAERRLADNVGPGPVEGLLDFASLPTDWRTKARETLGAIGGTNAPGMSVMMSAADGYLVLQRRMLKFTGKTPFTARVPLGAVESVKVGRPQLGLIGSSLVFTLSTGEEIRVDVAVGEDSAELIAEVFRQAPARPGDGLTQPPASAKIGRASCRERVYVLV